jgi:hypothetical protein
VAQHRMAARLHPSSPFQQESLDAAGRQRHSRQHHPRFRSTPSKPLQQKGVDFRRHLCFEIRDILAACIITLIVGSIALLAVRRSLSRRELREPVGRGPRARMVSAA